MKFRQMILMFGLTIGITGVAEAKKKNADEGVLIEITELDAEWKETLIVYCWWSLWLF